MLYRIRIGHVVIDSKFVEMLAEKAIDTILSELPEEAQTHDITKYILDEASKRISMRIIKKDHACVVRR